MKFNVIREGQRLGGPDLDDLGRGKEGTMHSWIVVWCAATIAMAMGKSTQLMGEVLLTDSNNLCVLWHSCSAWLLGATQMVRVDVCLACT